MFNKALYYPWILIQDEAWLKTSALYWNEISTIVPASMGKPYSDSDSRALEEEGILKPLRVTSSSRETAALRNEVIEYFDDYKNYYANVIAGHECDKCKAHIYWEKIDTKLHSLIQSRLHDFNDNYVKVDQNFSDFYMTILANRIAQSKGLNLITDTPRSEEHTSEPPTPTTMICFKESVTTSSCSIPNFQPSIS